MASPACAWRKGHSSQLSELTVGPWLLGLYTFGVCPVCPSLPSPVKILKTPRSLQPAPR